MPALEGARARVSGWVPGVHRQNCVVVGRLARSQRVSQVAVSTMGTAGIAVREGRLRASSRHRPVPPGGGDWRLVKPGEARISGHTAAPGARDAVGAASR
jgi:hypothetical protein